ncbi:MULTISPECIES: hypothetical protein [unclassified Streptomyces]|uniref:hypothetical protein n=1 Tax=unclassified Streptomyces TaxID=2593676 RepID=UPI000372917E|nr:MULTISPECIES: hypothetical protein [unclassified Streptomyces]MYQ79777.1 hypothetical protein [Streptomyces sp. SID4923]NEC06709.1 hypothetical protein [Streptomyces sp. SID7909]
MSYVSADPVRAVLDDPRSAAVLVTTVATRGPDHTRRTAEQAVADARRAPWPRGLLSLTVYTSGDDDSVLTYAQWDAEDRIPATGSVDGAGAVSRVFRHYRTVRGTAVEEPAPVPESFPAAFFPAEDEQAARAWLDGLLAGEERTEGDDRAYPGALAAHLHIAVDGGQVLSFSEWVAEGPAVDHIEAVWAPVLKDFGGTGTLYRHHRTLLPPDAAAPR